jgi:hypothetical protein
MNSDLINCSHDYYILIRKNDRIYMVYLIFGKPLTNTLRDRHELHKSYFQKI